MVLLEEFEGAGLGALTLILLTLFVSFAPLLGRVRGFCAAGSMICGYCNQIENSLFFQSNKNKKEN